MYNNLIAQKIFKRYREKQLVDFASVNSDTKIEILAKIAKALGVELDDPIK